MSLPRKKLPLDLVEYLKVDSSSPSNLVWVSGKRRGHNAGNLDDNGYYVVRFRGSAYKAHRIVWFLSNNLKDTELLIDHIDGNKTNNKISNLRLVTEKENARNRRACINRKHSEFKGVTLAVNTFKKPWRADIKVEGKSITIGNYRTKEEAAKAYNNAARIYFGEYARLNSV